MCDTLALARACILSARVAKSPGFRHSPRSHRAIQFAALRTAQTFGDIGNPRIPSAYPSQEVRRCAAHVPARATQNQAVLTELVGQFFYFELAAHAPILEDIERRRPYSSARQRLLYKPAWSRASKGR